MTNTDVGGTNLNPPTKSKINFVQYVGLAAGVLVYFGIDMPPETQAAVAAGLAAGVQVVTWVLRTFFTG